MVLICKYAHIFYNSFETPIIIYERYMQRMQLFVYGKEKKH